MDYRKPIQSAISRIWRLDQARFTEKPVFVVACARSGSTALCSALGRHPRVLMAEQEGPLMVWIGEVAYQYALGKVSGYMRGSVRLEPEVFRRSFKQLCYTSAWGLRLGYSYNPGNLHSKNWAFSRGRCLEYWGIKAFPSSEAADGLSWLYPQVKFVYLFRNGLDVVQSMAKWSFFRELGFAERCRWWRDNAVNFEYLRAHERAVTVRHEELVMDTERAFERICSHLEIPFDPEPVAYARSTIVHPLGKPTTQGDPREEYARRRRGYLDWSEEQRSIFRNLCSGAMESLGYEMPF